MSSDQQPSPAQVFEDYFGPAIFRPWGKVLLELAPIKAGETLLDLACATGTIARQVAQEHGETVEVFGLDFSPMMLDVARQTASSAGLEIAWAEGSSDDLPYSDSTFDHVVCQQGLQFFPNRAGSAREIYRVLKPGGQLTASVWQGVDVHPLYGSIFRAVANHLDAPFEAVSLPFSMGDASVLESYVGSGGFEKVTVSQHQLDMTFTSPDRFVQLNVAGATAAIPAFSTLDAQQRGLIAAEIADSLKIEVANYAEGDVLKIPSAVNIVIATK